MKIGRWRVWLKELAVAAAVFGSVFFIGQEMRLAKQRGGGGVMAGATVAPEFELYDMRHQEMRALRDLRGRPVILSFWGTWCGVCRDELPLLEELHRRSGDDFHVVTVAHDPPAALERYLRKHPEFSMPCLVDPPGRVHRTYKVTAVPTTVILDAQGRVVHDFTGSADMGVLEDHMQKLNAN